MDKDVIDKIEAVPQRKENNRRGNHKKRQGERPKENASTRWCFGIVFVCHRYLLLASYCSKFFAINKGRGVSLSGLTSLEIYV